MMKVESNTVLNEAVTQAVDWKISVVNTLSDNPQISKGELTPETNAWRQSKVVQIKMVPNSVKNQRALLRCTLFLSSVVILIGIILALFGAWLILPFAGLEVLILAGSTLVVRTHANDIDVITVSEKHVHLTRRRKSKQTVNSSVRQWTQIKIEPGTTSHEPSRLLMGSHGRYLEIGEYLVDSLKWRQCQQLMSLISNDV